MQFQFSKLKLEPITYGAHEMIVKFARVMPPTMDGFFLGTTRRPLGIQVKSSIVDATLNQQTTQMTLKGHLEKFYLDTKADLLTIPWIAVVQQNMG